MELHLDVQETRETKLAYEERIEALKKAKKKLEDLGVATHGVDDSLAILRGGGGDGGLLARVDDQTWIQPSRRGEEREPDGPTVEESLEGLEKDVETKRRAEARRALAYSIGIVRQGEEDGDLVEEPGAVPEDAAEMDDGAIAVFLLDVWEPIEYEDAEGDAGEKVWPGILRHETEAGDVKWCAVKTDFGVPQFFYDVDPETFDAASAVATFAGEQLFREVRRAWGVLEDEVFESFDAVEWLATSVAEWRQATRPKADVGATTEGIMQGVHTLLFAADDLGAKLFAVRESGITDEDLRAAIVDSFAKVAVRSCSEGLGMHVDGQAPEWVHVEIDIDPLKATLKRGRKREALTGEDLLAHVRAMLELPEPGSEEEAAEAGTGEEAEETAEEAEAETEAAAATA